jgi:hypothetical protein
MDLAFYLDVTNDKISHFDARKLSVLPLVQKRPMDILSFAACTFFFLSYKRTANPASSFMTSRLSHFADFLES